MKKGCIIFGSLLLLLMSCNNSSTDTKEADKKSADTVAGAPAAEAKDPEASKGLSLIAKSDCLTCHKLTEPLIGPAYALVAAKYKGQPGMIDTLANKIIKGGSGVWGTVPMTPHPAVSLEDAKTMVHYVLSIKN
jgi:cytochrome c